MIDLSFTISNPWGRTWRPLRAYSYNTPFKNKYIEIETIRDNTIASFEFKITANQSHAGLYLGLGLLGYVVNFTFYDSRHWDYKNNDWENYD
jgi:hypothetical protein